MNWKQPQNGPMEIGYRLAVCLPPLAIGVLLTFGFVREQAASVRLSHRIDALRDSGDIISTLTHLNAADQATSRDGAAAWTEILSSAEALQFLRPDRTTDEHELVAPGQPWSALPLLEIANEASEPLRERLEFVLEDTSLVWKPFEMNSDWSAHAGPPDLDPLMDVLADAFRVSVHAGNRDQAISHLLMMDETIRRFDSFKFEPLETLDRAYLLNDLIRRSVAMSFWEPDHLADLEQILERRTSHQGALWEKVVETSMSRVAAIASVILGESADAWFGYWRNPHQMGLSPLHVEGLLNRGEQLHDLSKPDISILGMRSNDDVDRRRQLMVGKTSLVSIPLARNPYWPGINPSYAAERLIDHRNRNRWTKSALALRRFEMENGRFPENLFELQRHVNSQNIGKTFGGHWFGYDRFADDNEAFLWLYDEYGHSEGMRSGYSAGRRYEHSLDELRFTSSAADSELSLLPE
ncbi:MAG: hypothetical protein AAGJ40_24435 [Planctomycetota bacterium]